MNNNRQSPFFLTRFREIFPGFEESSFNARELSVRINTLHTDSIHVEKEFRKTDISFENVPWYRDAYILPGMTPRQMTENSLYKEGDVYIQSLSSMIPALILAPSAHEYVLDMASAPGSKTSQMSALMENKGEIIANDIDKRRLYKLNAVLDMLGVQNVKVTSYAGQALWTEFPEAFDKVLLDAPCSMEGTLFYEKATKIKRLARLQKWLLRSAVSCTRPGGELVYSTCSMAPEENEEVIDWILKKEEGIVELREISLDVPERLEGMTRWQGKSFAPSLSRTLRIPPSNKMEQFFVARLVKAKSNVIKDL